MQENTTIKENSVANPFPDFPGSNRIFLSWKSLLDFAFDCKTRDPDFQNLNRDFPVERNVYVWIPSHYIELVNNHDNTCQKYVTVTKCHLRSSHLWTLLFCLLTGKPPTPENDLGFAITAGSSYGDETFKLMKDTIAEVATGCGTEKTKYGLIVFGNTSIVKIQFINVTNVDDLINHLMWLWTLKVVLPWTKCFKDQKGYSLLLIFVPMLKQCLKTKTTTRQKDQNDETD